MVVLVCVKYKLYAGQLNDTLRLKNFVFFVFRLLVSKHIPQKYIHLDTGDTNIIEFLILRNMKKTEALIQNGVSTCFVCCLLTFILLFKINLAFVVKRL